MSSQEPAHTPEVAAKAGEADGAVTKIFVTKVFGVPSQEVRDFFGQFGTVRSLHMCRKITATGRSVRCPYGFLEMSSEEEAQRVLKEATGQKLGENEIVCEAARPHRAPRPHEAAAGPARASKPRKVAKKSDETAAPASAEGAVDKAETEAAPAAPVAAEAEAAAEPRAQKKFGTPRLRAPRKPRQPRRYPPCLLVKDLPEDATVACICKLFKDVALSSVSIIRKQDVAARVRLADEEGYAPYADVHELSCPDCDGKTFPVELLNYPRADEGEQEASGADNE